MCRSVGWRAGPGGVRFRLAFCGFTTERAVVQVTPDEELHNGGGISGGSIPSLGDDGYWRVRSGPPGGGRGSAGGGGRAHYVVVGGDESEGGAGSAWGVAGAALSAASLRGGDAEVRRLTTDASSRINKLKTEKRHENFNKRK